MSPNTLGVGSGLGPPAVGDYTVAGIATRVVSSPPSDADWGSTPPPNGTIVLESDGILWVRLGGSWKSTVLV